MLTMMTLAGLLFAGVVGVVAVVTALALTKLTIQLVLIPLIKPLKLPIEQTDSVRKAWEMVEGLNEGDALLISVDFGPSTAPECLPVYVSLLHQCFRKGIKPIIVTLVTDGRGMAIRGRGEALPHTAG